jgi:spore germination protein
MIRGIIITLLCFVIVGTGVWGYQEHRDKNAVLLHSENQYQRAFHDLAYQMDLLHDQLGATLAMNSRKSISPSLAEVWRISAEAKNDTGQLPLTLLPFNKTEEFLADIGNFSYQTAIRDLNKEPLSEKEHQTLNLLYKESGNIRSDLRDVQEMVLKNNLRWMDVDLALSTNKEPKDNTIIDGFKAVETKVQGFDATQFPPGFQRTSESKNSLQFQNQKIVTKKKAVEIARSWGESKDSKVKVSKSKKGSRFVFYNVNLTGENGQGKSVDVSEKGGYVLNLISNRHVKTGKVSLNEASIKAQNYLKNKGLNNLKIFSSNQYDQIGVFDFAVEKGGVLYYPQTVHVKVALDNKEIIGFSGDEYYRHYLDPTIDVQSISSTEARKSLSPKFTVIEERKSVITVNDSDKQVLCYEFIGTLGADSYRIFINAQTGEEEEVTKLTDEKTL